MSLIFNNRKGFTLAELLIASSLGAILALSVSSVVYNFAKNWSLSRDKDRLYQAGESVMQEFMHQSHWADSVEISEDSTSITIKINDSSANYSIKSSSDGARSFLVKSIGDDEYFLTGDDIYVSSFVIQNRSNDILGEGNYVPSYQLNLSLRYQHNPGLFYDTSRIISLRQKGGGV